MSETVPHQEIENHRVTPRRESGVRAKKPKHGDRAANKGDGSLVLTSTNAYTVSKLPALPDRIRSDSNLELQGEIACGFGYALTLTHTHAIVWPYTSTSQSPETFTFNLPSSSKHGEPLPVGCFVSPSAAASEPGLLVVMAGSGKIVYWESISSAATFAFIKKERTGVESVISGMTHGEKVDAITNAESAGFVLAFNTGRLAYLNVRDGHGRPSISVQFLRSALAPSGSGFFGSIRHAFSNLSIRGDVAAVRADRSNRVGERNIVALGSKGKIQAWKIYRGGHNEPLGDIDMRDQIVSALYESDPKSEDYSADSFEALDLVFVPKGLEPKYLQLSKLSDAMASDDSDIQHLLLLVGLNNNHSARYALVEVIFTATEGHTGMVRTLTSYSTPISRADVARPTKPRLYLPRPALVAFVVFDRAAVIASVAIQPESPEAQLQSDSHILPSSFEDVVDFREDNAHEILGSGFEELPPAYATEENRNQRHKTKNPAAMLLVRGAGVIRLVTTDIDKFASEKPPTVTAKSKMEQAVFFGVKQENPLIFDARQEVSFSNQELCEAALEVSGEILSSTTTFIATLPAHLEENLRARANALERLMDYLRTTKAKLNRATRWQLLFNAEKMHVAALLWKRQEAFTAERSADDKKSVIGYIVEFINEKNKHPPRPALGEVDPVRHWFINDINRMDLFVAWTYEVIKVLYQGSMLSDQQFAVMLFEAMQVLTCSHSMATSFRQHNLAFYGLSDEDLDHGILVSGYQGLGEPWTGTSFAANSARRLAELASSWSESQLRKGRSDADSIAKPIDQKLLRKIVGALPDVTDSMLTAVHEFARFAESSGHSDHRHQGQEFANTYGKDKYERPRLLARVFDLWEAAADLTKKHRSMKGLASILLDHIVHLEAVLSEDGVGDAEKQRVKAVIEKKKSEIGANMARFGHKFAFPLYDYLLEEHGAGAVLDFELDTAGLRSQYLRSKNELSKITWINDVQQDKDAAHAYQTLFRVALAAEQQVWNKKVELSLARLALLADAEAEVAKPDSLVVQTDAKRRAEDIQMIKEERVAVQMQELLYEQILPSTANAIDDAAALNFAMDVHGSNIPRKQKVLRQVFEHGLESLLQHEVVDPMTLIDLLTLFAPNPDLDVEDYADPFWMALQVAESSCPGDVANDAKRLIWRRLLIRDDWAKLNNTNLKNDEEVTASFMGTALYSCLYQCIAKHDAREPFQPPRPQDVLGVFTEQLDSRFAKFGADDQAKLREAMKQEDKLLTTAMEKHRLPEWFRTVFDGATTQVQNYIDDQTAAGALMQDGAA